MSAAGLREPRAAKALLIAAAVAYVGLMLVLPLGAVLTEALRKGWQTWLAAVSDPDARASIRLTLIVAAISVPLNTVFGLAAAWAIAKFDFRGKTTLIALIELPFSVSPVVSGLVFVLLFGAQGWFGPWLQDARRPHHLRTPRAGARDGLRHLSVCCSSAHPADDQPRPRRRGSRAHHGRFGLADLLASDPSQHPLRTPLRRAAMQRASNGGVWGSQRRFRSHPRRDQYHAASD